MGGASGPPQSKTEPVRNVVFYLLKQNIYHRVIYNTESSVIREHDLEND
jgi:hypothetical protein